MFSSTTPSQLRTWRPNNKLKSDPSSRPPSVTSVDPSLLLEIDGDIGYDLVIFLRQELKESQHPSVRRSSFVPSVLSSIKHHSSFSLGILSSSISSTYCMRQTELKILCLVKFIFLENDFFLFKVSTAPSPQPPARTAASGGRQCSRAAETVLRSGNDICQERLICNVLLSV